MSVDNIIVHYAKKKELGFLDCCCTILLLLLSAVYYYCTILQLLLSSLLLYCCNHCAGIKVELDFYTAAQFCCCCLLFTSVLLYEYYTSLWRKSEGVTSKLSTAVCIGFILFPKNILLLVFCLLLLCIFSTFSPTFTAHHLLRSIDWLIAVLLWFSRVEPLRTYNSVLFCLLWALHLHLFLHPTYTTISCARLIDWLMQFFCGSLGSNLSNGDALFLRFLLKHQQLSCRVVCTK